MGVCAAGNLLPFTAVHGGRTWRGARKDVLQRSFGCASCRSSKRTVSAENRLVKQSILVFAHFQNESLKGLLRRFDVIILVDVDQNIPSTEPCKVFPNENSLSSLP